MELDLYYWNQNVRGRQGLRKGQSLILCTVGKLLCDSHETLQKNSVQGWLMVMKMEIYATADLSVFSPIFIVPFCIYNTHVKC